ncbi:MAG: hypothetical protein AAFU64_16050, partial [Bacteroidota bacterium]
NIILDSLDKNLHFLAAILNKELPWAWYQSLERQGIHLFPRQWEDLDLSCDCPDWARPCKHSSALVYYLISLFDQAPTKLFYFRNLDLQEALLKKTGQLRPLGSDIPTIRFINLGSDAIPKPTASLSSFNESDSVTKGPQQLLHLLNPRPIFHPKSDFREVLFQNYRQVAQGLQKTPPNTLFSKGSQWSEKIEGIQIWIDDYFRLRQVNRQAGKEVIPAISRPDLECLIEELNHLNPDDIKNYPSGVQSLFAHYHFARYLIKNGAYRPEVMELDSQKYLVNWLPAMMFDPVKKGVHHLLSEFPCRILYGFNRQGKKSANAQAQSFYLISLFLNYFVAQYGYRPPSPQMPWMYRFFFRQMLISKESSEALRAEWISNWLAPIRLQEQGLIFCLEVEAIEGRGRKIQLFFKKGGKKYLFSQEHLFD